MLAVAVGLVSGAGGDATATVDSDVEAFIGPRTGAAATVVTTTSGNVDVLAVSTQNATATASGGAGGAVTASWCERHELDWQCRAGLHRWRGQR